MTVLKFYKSDSISRGAAEVLRSRIQTAASHIKLKSFFTESCFYVDVKDQNFDEESEEKLKWILGTPFQDDKISTTSSLSSPSGANQCLIEIGPRLNFCTAFSTNAVSMCNSAGLNNVLRIEASMRYFLEHSPEGSGDCVGFNEKTENAILAVLHDKMTQCRYLVPLTSFEVPVNPEDIFEVDVLGRGQAALQEANDTLGLAFDSWDLDYYTKLFQEQIKRNPTSVECFDLAQSNSEHSRHWFFKGRMVVDGVEEKDSLFSMVMSTQDHSNNNNIIKFNDNSSAIRGYDVTVLKPTSSTEPSVFIQSPQTSRHIIFTAETHNFPTGVAPFPGATTGTGGRIRDVQATGRGAHPIAGTAGYSFGNLNIPGYRLPWEDETFQYPPNFAPPLEIAIEASNGASDYGNKFGEPVLAGFARSFGMKTPDLERREWIKPIMFSGGIGSLEGCHVKKMDPEQDMEVIKIGGPVYRIGVGGGAASSIQVQGDNLSELDFGAVQRGDAEMEQKMNRIIRACIEMGEDNPICSIHDQGAGGNGNVLKEICEPKGALILASKFKLGDPTLTVLELWGAEYQESNAALVRNSDKHLLEQLATREKCDVSFVGSITGDGKIRLEDDRCKRDKVDEQTSKRNKTSFHYPVDLDLEYVLASMPRKVFDMKRSSPRLTGLQLPEGLTVKGALERVLRLPAVASKRYLTNKVDRSVTGLVAQQQCVGPLHTPLADVAVVALSHFDKVGGATAIGEQPIKGLVDPSCGARMTVGEVLTNLVFARISDLKDVKCSGNWMWAAKLPGEGAALYDACRAMCDVMSKLGIAVDGGKDSLSMAARVGKDVIKAPGTLVVSAYAPCPDITATVTPDLKCPGDKGCLLYVDLSSGQHRLGGSALAQTFQQIGDVSPDLDDPTTFISAFKVTQKCIEEGLLEAGHDVSDGGLITCVLEMAFAGNVGLELSLPMKGSVLEVLFAEELGLVLEVSQENLKQVTDMYKQASVTCHLIGYSHTDGPQSKISVSVAGTEVLQETMVDLRDMWEETSFQLESLQANPYCVEQEKSGLRHRMEPPYNVTFNPDELPIMANLGGMEPAAVEVKVAIIREEGSNGDREMAAAFHMAGFQTWDINMQDLSSGRITLDGFRGIAFVGGFSYADVCGSAKGWAAAIKYNEQVREEFDKFYQRGDTFSFGVCNGCQLMALLGWVAPDKDSSNSGQGVHLDHNLSERYESRFVTVTIKQSPAVMLRDMEDCVLGVWVSHGEGRFIFKSSEIRQSASVPIYYVDDSGATTEQYPLNPNGSEMGIAAVCSADGRHLAMMPHPERCFLPWQCPWQPTKWRHAKHQVSPWMKVFTNAYEWCVQGSQE